MYAKKLTKEELIKGGITNVTADGRVFKGDREVFPTRNKQGYLMHFIYDLDENGNKIKIPGKKYACQYTYKQRHIGLHRLMWAWHYGEVASGMVVDHISNKHTELEDYVLSNLNCITPAENVRKERTHVRVVNMPKYMSEEKINKKLAYWTEQYELAKKNKDAYAAHRCRSSLSEWRAKRRQFLAEPEKYARPAKPVNERLVRAAKRKELQANIDNARKYYKEAREAYGSKDAYVKKLWGEWKLAIAMLHAFEEETNC